MGEADGTGKTPVERDQHCLGVLFVHGAGEHGKGGTLLSFGQPIAHWLDGWLRGDADEEFDEVRIDSAQIVKRDQDPDAPANVTLTVSGADGRPHRWLLAESWWDAAFAAPSFSHVVQWALTIVPWVAVTQFIGPAVSELRRLDGDNKSSTDDVLPEQGGRIVPMLWLIGALFAGVAASIVLEAIAIFLLILAILPISAVREFVGSAIRWVSGSVGDLYIALASPFQRATLAACVNRDIAWMRAHGATKVVVIAHSQGGYVAHRALTTGPSEPIDKFITLGSGIIRLYEASRARRTRFMLLSLVASIGAVLATIGAPDALNAYFGLASPDAVLVGLGLVGVACILLGVASAVRLVAHEPFRVSYPARATSWTDYLASSDPVVNGATTDRLPTDTNQVIVHNRGSITADHSAYWANGDEFVAKVVMEIATLDAGLGLELMPQGRASVSTGGVAAAKEASALRISRASGRRAWRVRILVAARYATAAVALALLLRSSTEVLDVGTWILTAIRGATTWLPEVITKDWAPILPSGPIPTLLLGVVGFCLPIAFAHRVSVALWDRWGSRDLRRFLARQDPDDGGVDVGLFASWVILLVLTLGYLVVRGVSATVADIVVPGASATRVAGAWLVACGGGGLTIIGAYLLLNRKSDADPLFVPAVTAAGVLTAGACLAAALVVDTYHPEYILKIAIMLSAGVMAAVLMLGASVLIAPLIATKIEQFSTSREPIRRKIEAYRPTTAGTIGAVVLALIAVGGVIFTANANGIWSIGFGVTFMNRLMVLLLAAASLTWAAITIGLRPKPGTRARSAINAGVSLVSLLAAWASGSSWQLP